MTAQYDDLESGTTDLGPLAWVLDETRKSIQAAAKALKHYARQVQTARGVDLESVDANPLRVARQQLHQAEGALSMVGQTIAARMVSGMEGAVQRFVAKPQEIDQKSIAVQETAGFALIEYLESQLNGQPRPALGLFAQYRQVQELAGADRIHPADLWDWPWQWRTPQLPRAVERLSYSVEVRQRLDRRILRTMRDDDAGAAADLSAISLSLAAGENPNHPDHPAAFWTLAAGFFEALGGQCLPPDLYVKRAIARVLLQYITLAKGDGMVSERLAHDLLFFCAQARAPDNVARLPALAAVRAAWELTGYTPVDYSQPMFGLYDPAILTQARRPIDAIKDNWSALAGGDMRRLQACSDQLGLVTELLARLLPEAQPLADELKAVMAQVARANHPPSPELAMETATAILFLEASFADFHPADALVGSRMRQLAQRLRTVREGGAVLALEPWMEALYRQVSDRQTMGTVVGELRVTMGEVEGRLDQFFREPADQGPLAQVPDLLTQMRGVLSVLGLDQAVQAVARMREQVQGLMTGGSGQASGVFDKLGNSLGSLGFLVDMLGYQPALARKLFVFDTDSGELKTPMARGGAHDRTALQTQSAAKEQAAPAVQSAPLPEVPVVLPDQTGKIALDFDLTEPEERATAASLPAVAPSPLPGEADKIALDFDLAEPEGRAAPAALPGEADKIALAFDLTEREELATAASLPAVAPAALPGEADKIALDFDLAEPEELAAPAPLLAVPAALPDEADKIALDFDLAEPEEPAAVAKPQLSGEQEPLSGPAIAVSPAPRVLTAATPALQGQLGRIIEQAALEDKLALAAATRRAVEATHQQDAAGLAAALQAVNVLLGTVPTASVADAAPGQDSRHEDDDLLGIFLDEAREVIAGGQSAIASLAVTPGDIEQKIILRRAFHTLKGSSRMVELFEFGEAAWAMEQVLNTWLAEQKPVAADLRGLSAQALHALNRWVDDIAARTAAHWSAAPFRQAADALRLHGRCLPLDLDGASDRLLESPETDEPVAPVPAPGFDVHPFPDLSLSPAEPMPPELNAPDVGHWSDADEDAGSAASQPERVQADAEPVLAADAGPAVEQPAARTQEVPAAEPERQAEVAAPAGADPVPAQAAQEPPPAASKQIGDLRISAELYEVYLEEAQGWSRDLSGELARWEHAPDQSVPELAIARAHSLAGSSATVGCTALSELARAVEHALIRLHGQAGGRPAQLGTLGDAAAEIARALRQFAAGSLPEPNQALLDGVNAIKAMERPAPASVVTSIQLKSAPRLGTAVQAFTPAAVEAPVQAPLQAGAPGAVTVKDAPRHAVADNIDATDAVDPDLFPVFAEEAQELLPRLQGSLRAWAANPGHDDEALKQVKRLLHTLKGSARLAGALRLGEMAHRAESAIEAIGTEHAAHADLEPILDHVDEITVAFDRLRVDRRQQEQAGGTAPLAHGAVESSPAVLPVVVSITTSVPAGAPVAAPLPALPDTAAQAGERPTAPAEPAHPGPGRPGEIAPPAPLLHQAYNPASQVVRVKTQLLDRLVNQAGEVISARSRLETGVGQLRSALTDLSGNLSRLRTQLRDVELQAETQMQSRMARTKDEPHDFDPLEFDRFTRMQELTRMMAESVNDVAMVQRVLQRAVASGEDDLVAQGRQARELQHGLLRTRMVEFESIAERLYRVVRQTAKEQGKQVRLDIVGGAIEVDRGILERMAGAFEHLLRNSVVHGIEAAPLRAERHKDATGLITIEVRQASNNVSIEFRDDGNGLDLQHIRRQAEQKGLVDPQQPLSDDQIANLVFASGLSTVSQVSGLAGRGVGMDVVRTEVQALGGRIEIHTQAGSGSAFKLVLPLTTAVTQVVMLRMGELTIGVPSNLVEIVRRVSQADLQQAYDTGAYYHGGGMLSFFWGGALLQGSPRSQELTARTAPVIVFHSAGQRVALHVDEVLGNQEVVVKALGPQLSRLPGLVAITALASGEVSLIYNPVALANVYGDQAKALMSGAGQPAAQGQGTASAASAARTEAPLVLVVDDSITVRRVVQRLLQREGYRVALAADGLQGLEQLRKERPAVILSDIEMPRMDGFDFVRNIRADQQWRDLPVIIITSRIAEKHRQHARELGVDRYLGKPYSEEELLTLIRDYTQAAAQAHA